MKKADGSHHGRHQRSTMDRLTNFVKKKHRQSIIEEERGEFHEKCGKFVVFDPDRLVASRQADTSSNGIVFSAKPIPARGMFQVKILSLSQCTGSLAIGFTSLDPGSPEPIPITIDDYRRRDDYWMLWGNIACFEGLKRDFSTANLVEGDSVGCCIGNNGSLEYFVNGERKGIICHNVPSNKPLYGVADMCGRIKKIQSEFHFNDITQNQEKDMEQRVATLEAKVASQSVKMDAIQRTLAAQIQELLLEQKQQIRQEMQQEFEARIQRVEGHMRERPPTWNIAKHQIEITEEILGRGAWGEVRIGVYQGTRVAIKKMHYVIISDYNRELFEREMENTSSVRHPNLVLFIGAVTTGNLTIVSELLEVSVRKLLEEGKLKLPDIRPIGKDVASALAYLHSLADPIIHRSVSSGNVLLHAKQDGWCAKLGDFASANFLAKLGTVGQGNATYSAPEVGNPSQQLQDPKMDVYSFGILLLEMCVGKLIAEHNLDMTKSAVKRWSSSDHNKKLLGDWAVRCTERDPNDRPDMVDFVKQLWPTVVHVTQVIV